MDGGNRKVYARENEVVKVLECLYSRTINKMMITRVGVLTGTFAQKTALKMFKMRRVLNSTFSGCTRSERRDITTTYPKYSVPFSRSAG